MVNVSEGQIITFYSYKGGSSRSMALANVAWILASNGKRVLAVDWDLEAPGLHRYFTPFLTDEELTSSPGVIDLMWQFATEAMTPPEKTTPESDKWYEPLTDVSSYVVRLQWTFPSDGTIDFMPAGRQGLSYARRVNSFNWQSFYERLGGGVFLEAVKHRMRQQYDYILIDSRTGVSDTAGICTVQMPDTLVVFFTANNQSIAGCASVAESVYTQWYPGMEQPTQTPRRIYPVLARVERAEYTKLDSARNDAKIKFARFLRGMPRIEQANYWARVEIPHFPWYAFEEVLATFRDEPNRPDSLLTAFEQLTYYLTGREVSKLKPPTAQQREEVLALFARRPAATTGTLVLYSSADEIWKDRLMTHLAVLQHEGSLEVWDDGRIGAEDNGYVKIQEAINRASAAVLLVSDDFLTSNFILREEVPRLLKDASLRIFAIIVRPCNWKPVLWRSGMTLYPRDGRPLSDEEDHQVDAELAALVEELGSVTRSSAWAHAPENYRTLEPSKVSLAKLPSTHPDLFGREQELALLDAAWADPQVNVLCLVAWGGVGKTALVNRWLLDMGQADYRGAEWVLGWSFYSQGAAEGRQVSADQFIAHALDWFGDPDPAHGSPWDKGERLAELVKQRRSLLILDGLEPLQNPPPVETGRIKDPGLLILIRELARYNPGLCIVTTRLPVDDLKDFVGVTARQVDLEHLSPEAGAAYLKHLGVKGTQAELQAASREFGGHALALTLLGSYLATAYRGDVRQRDKIARLAGEQRQGPHARRMMAAYERWFRGKPEGDILHLMGLFDRPAEGGAIAALRLKPAIEGLTAQLKGLSDEDWLYAVANLRAARLLADEDPHDPETLDCHPLVREHFGEGLRAGNPAAWREAHGRLYEYYKCQASEYPDSVEEMAPLYAAVMHGCQAGRHQEALDEVYWRRIQRGNEAFNVKKLGAIDAELAVLSGFFDPPWRRPVDGLSQAAKAFVLAGAGFALRALGRLAEAAQPMQVGLEAQIAQQNWKNAAIQANNLSELTLTAGDLAQAVRYAEQSVELADRSGEWNQRITIRTALADALHQAGRPAEAEALFRQAEVLQQEHQPEFPLLYSLQGYQYCDLLLGQGQWGEVLRRAEQTLEWAKQAGGSLLTIALDHLSLGRASLLQVQAEGTGDFSTATTHLDRAVDGLRRAGTQHELPRGLLARAALRRITQDYHRARADVEEALAIAQRGGMRLHEADCHLEFARLHLACGEGEQARASLARAKAVIQEMGYHRRDGEVAELEAALRGGGGSPAEQTARAT